MIERYVFLKLTEAAATPEGRRQVAERARELGQVAGVASLHVGLPADAAADGAWDVSLRVCFESTEALERYREDALHRRFVDEYLTPRLQVLKAWSFEV
ncbi:MAG: Dabb family protein [Myxococcales bacterium]|nr:Dabb family protein [Myxococcales bacterium]